MKHAIALMKKYGKNHLATGISKDMTVSYTFNKEKGITTCVLRAAGYAVQRIGDRYLEASGVEPLYAYDVVLGKHFVGIAKCHPENTWNEEIGKRMAHDHALRNYKAAVSSELHNYIRRLEHAVNLIESHAYLAR